MPYYRAKQRGYIDDQLREPGSIFESPTEFKKTPSWLEVLDKNPGQATPPVPTPAPTNTQIRDDAIPTKQPEVEPGQETRVARIKQALVKMMNDDPQRENPDMWIGNGKPDIKEITQRTGYNDISAKERDQLWEQVTLPPSGKTPIA